MKKISILTIISLMIFANCFGTFARGSVLQNIRAKKRIIISSKVLQAQLNREIMWEEVNKKIDEEKAKNSNIQIKNGPLGLYVVE